MFFLFGREQTDEVEVEINVKTVKKKKTLPKDQHVA